MTIENALAANDTTLPDQTGAEPEEVEVEYDGQTYSVPAALKDALLRQADYTRKTQEVAEGRKALDADRMAHSRSSETARAHIQDAARIVALNDQLAHYDKIDWGTLQAQAEKEYQAGWQSARVALPDMPAGGLLDAVRDYVPPAWTAESSSLNSFLDRGTMGSIDFARAGQPESGPGPQKGPEDAWNRPGVQVSSLAEDPKVKALLKPGVPYPQGQAANLLGCLVNTYPGLISAISSTHEPVDSHAPTDPHMQFQGADVKTAYPQQVMQAGADCGAIYQQDEYAHPSAKSNGTHVHLQTRTGRNGATGPFFAPIVRLQPWTP